MDEVAHLVDSVGENSLMSPSEQRQTAEQTRLKLSWISKIAFASGHFLNVLGWAMWSTYGLTYFTKVLELPHTTTGNIIMAVQVFGAISLPFLGVWSDQTRLRYGRRKVFLLGGMVAIAGSFFFLWHECIYCSHTPATYQAVYFVSFGIVFAVGWSAIGLPQLSLVSELAPDKPTIVQLNALRYCYCLVNYYYELHD